MKKIIVSCVALLATFFCASTISAQGIKIHKVGTDEVIDIPASQLDYIEAYDIAKAAPFEGTWKMRELYADRTYMEEQGYGMVTYNDTYPSFNTEDEITFKDGKIIPNFKSNFKNFFKGEATYEIVNDAYVIHPKNEIGSAVTVTELKVKGVNRNFDANSTSEDDEAYIGVRLVEDEDAEESGIYFLEIYLIDYTPKTFGTEWYEFGYFGDNKPNADGGGVTIFFAMDKKENTANSRIKNDRIVTEIADFVDLEELLLTHEYSIVLFWATWARPSYICKEQIESLLNDYATTIGYGHIPLGNCTPTDEIAETYGIERIPTTLIFHNREKIDEIIGPMTGENRTKLLNYIQASENN